MHLAERSANDDGFGVVKLNKLLYRSDFEAFRLIGHSITGATYERQDYGPVARELPRALDALAARGYIQWHHPAKGPYVRDVPGILEAPDLSLFAKEELEIVDRSLDELSEHGGKSVSEWSHEESAGWRLNDNGAEITYESGLIDPTRRLDSERETLLREFADSLSE
jgi:hypothetical protein